jgi:formylglycine-generating enzyme required for sulfatase activity
MGSNPAWFARTGSGAAKVREVGDADLECFPVEEVTWNDTREFLARLNARVRDAGWVYRLPSAEEWEYACRGPVTCRADCAFSFHAGEPSNSLSSEQANFNGYSPVRVGSYPANRLGIFDLHGNVDEWTNTPTEGAVRVFCGGSWGLSGSCCTAASRSAYTPESRLNDLGFRVARVMSGQK